MRKLTN